MGATPADVEAIIRRVAGEYRFQAPDLLVATARQESALNPQAIGDQGQSYGVFQEHSRGRGAGIPVAARQDVAAATERAIREFAVVRQRFPDVDPGTWAAKAQRPLDPVGYARQVNALLGGAPPAGAAPGSAPASGATGAAPPDWYRQYTSRQSAPPSSSTPPAAAGGADWYRQYLRAGGSGGAGGGAGGTPALAPAPVDPGEARGRQPAWLELAASQLGKPYIWGSGSGAGGRGAGDVNRQTGQPDGFDCSGYVSWVYQQAFGVELPAYTGTAYPASRPVAADAARPGDLVFWNMNVPDPRRQHVAIYIGDGKVIQSGGQGSGVNIAPVTQMPGAEFRRVPAVAAGIGAAPAPRGLDSGAPAPAGLLRLQGAVAPAAPAAGPDWYRQYRAQGGT